MCGCVDVCAHVWGTHAHGSHRSEVNARCSSPSLSSLLFESGSLLEPGTHQTGLPVSFQDPPVSTMQTLGLQVCATMQTLGLQVCVTV